MTEPNVAWAKKNPEVIKTFVSAVPLGRAGEPEEIGQIGRASCRERVCLAV